MGTFHLKAKLVSTWNKMWLDPWIPWKNKLTKQDLQSLWDFIQKSEVTAYYIQTESFAALMQWEESLALRLLARSDVPSACPSSSSALELVSLLVCSFPLSHEHQALCCLNHSWYHWDMFGSCPIHLPHPPFIVTRWPSNCAEQDKQRWCVMRTVAPRALAQNFRFHSKFINHSDWYKIECSRMGQHACLISLVSCDGMWDHIKIFAE
jgi:hypothetical protein